MRVKSIDLVLGLDSGLRASKLHSLGDLVVLAGPNGAGKSRILRLVKKVLRHQHIGETISEIESSIRSYQSWPPGALRDDQLAIYSKALEYNRHTEIHSVTANGVLDFFPKSTTLEDSRDLTETNQKRKAEEFRKQIGLHGMNEAALCYISDLARRWFSATHQSLSFPTESKKKAIDDWERLADMIEVLLEHRPSWFLDQQPTLFGQPIPDAHLSEGQLVLLQVAVALHAQGSRLDGLVLLLDEPECHLHPVAVVNAVHRLRTMNPNGQVWLATHCVPILAAMPVDSMWFVSEGTASWAGRRPEAVLQGLLGGENGRERMEEFLRLPAQLASNRFAAECLIPPAAVDTGGDDPQALQLREFCELQAPTTTGPLKILDFGAGRGRLLSAMNERWSGNGQLAPKQAKAEGFGSRRASV